MPIDASIPLQVQQAPVQSPMQSIGKLMQLQGSLDARALHQAQIQTEHIQQQAAQVKLDEQKREIGEQQTFQEALKGGLGYEGTLNQLEKAGKVSPAFTVKARENFAKAVKERSLAGAAELEGHNKRLQTLGGGLAAIQLLDPAERPAAYSQWRTQMIADPDLSEDAKKLDEQYSDSLANRAKWMGGLTKDVNDAAIKLQQEQRAADKEKRDVQLFAETLKEKKTDLLTKEADLSKKYTDAAGVTPLTQDQIADNKRQEATATETARHNRAMEGHQAKELALKTGGTLSTLSPAQRNIAEKVAYGDMSVEQLSRLPDKETLINGAIEINPNWTRDTFTTKKAFRDPSSKQAQNLGTISRIVGHIGRFEKNSEKLGVSPSMLTGVSLTDDATAVSNDAHAIAGELEKLVSGGVGTVGQVHEWMKELKSSRPGIRKAAIDEISQLIGSQYEGMQQTYKAGTGQELPIEQYVSPEGRQWMSSKGIAGMKPVQPIKLKSGKTLIPHDAAAAEAFRRDHADLIQ